MKTPKNFMLNQTREDMESYCLRMRECGEGFSMNTTGVMLSMYDSLLDKEAN